MKRKTNDSTTAMEANKGTVQYTIVNGNTIVRSRKQRNTVHSNVYKLVTGANTKFLIIFLTLDSVTQIAPNLQGSMENKLPHR